MALIDANSPVVTDSKSFWQDQLTNTRILIYELDKAILVLERNEKESYTMDSGQSTITVRRVNLPELIKQRASLLKQLQDIESLNPIDADDPSGGFVQVVPY